MISMIPEPRIGIAVILSPRRTCSGSDAFVYDVKMLRFPVRVSGTVPVS